MTREMTCGLARHFAYLLGFLAYLISVGIANDIKIYAAISIVQSKECAKTNVFFAGEFSISPEYTIKMNCKRLG